MEDTILAVVVTPDSGDKVRGHANVFIAKDRQEAQRISLLLSRILKAMAHDLENGVTILVKH